MQKQTTLKVANDVKVHCALCGHELMTGDTVAIDDDQINQLFCSVAHMRLASRMDAQVQAILASPDTRPAV
jgi:hypothetical protein